MMTFETFKVEILWTDALVFLLVGTILAFIVSASPWG